MHLTAHTDFALRLLIYLKVFPEEPASVRQVSEAYGISSHHLAKVAQKLAQLGWITSQRGRGGGLMLEPDADELTLGHVVRTLEPPGTLVECHGDHSRCPIDAACHLKSILWEAQEGFYRSLDRYTIADLVLRPERLVALLGSRPDRR